MVEDGDQEQIIPPNINNTRYNYTLLPQNRALIQIYVNDHFCFRGSLKVRVLRVSNLIKFSFSSEATQ